MLNIQADDADAYGRRLPDSLLTKDEQRKSLFQVSSKSSKGALDKQRVTKLFGEYNKILIDH